MGYKPSDLFVGVIDFFAILLPGAIIVGVGLQLDGRMYGDAGLLQPVGDGAEAWVAFLVAAYLAGHLLFLVGALLDTSLYDPLRKTFVHPDRDLTFLQAGRVRNRVLGAGETGINTFQFSRSALKLQAPTALTEVERYEADSKFFRSLSVTLYMLLFAFLADGRGPGAVVLWTAMLLLPVGLAVAQIGRRVARWKGGRASSDAGSTEKPVTPAEPPQRGSPAQQAESVASELADTNRARAETKWADDRRWAIGVVCYSAVALLVLGGISSRWGGWRLTVVFALLVLSLWRYAERRWKSTRTAYTYAILLDRTADGLLHGPEQGG